MRTKLFLLIVIGSLIMRAPLSAAPMGQGSVDAVEACEDSGWRTWLPVSLALVSLAVIGILITEANQGEPVPDVNLAPSK